MLTKRLDLNDVKLLAYAGVLALGLVGTINSLFNPVLPSKPTIANDASATTRLRQAIVGQESGGNHKIENRSGSGAMGLGQVMPENLPSWSKAALGREISKEEFLKDPQLQIKIIDFKLKEYWDAALKQSGGNEDEAVRRVAAWWYSGDPNKFDDSKPQSWGKDSYPSISSYSQNVLSRWKETAQASSKPTTSDPATTGMIVTQPGQDPCVSLKPAFVSIYAGDEVGSGSVIRSDGLVVTNHHVVKEAQHGAKIYLKFLNGQRYLGKLVAANPARDLALVQIEQQGAFPSMPLTEQKPQKGEKLCAIGTPFGRVGTINHGHFTGWRGADLKAKIALRPGNSGGPLINDNGQIVGVNKSIWRDDNGKFTNTSFASSVQDVLNLGKSKGIDLNE